jgi:hypothetical protein
MIYSNISDIENGTISQKFVGIAANQALRSMSSRAKKTEALRIERFVEQLVRYLGDSDNISYAMTNLRILIEDSTFDDVDAMNVVRRVLKNSLERTVPITDYLLDRRYRDAAQTVLDNLPNLKQFRAPNQNTGTAY